MPCSVPLVCTMLSLKLILMLTLMYRLDSELTTDAEVSHNNIQFGDHGYCGDDPDMVGPSLHEIQSTASVSAWQQLRERILTVTVSYTHLTLPTIYSV